MNDLEDIRIARLVQTRLGVAGAIELVAGREDADAITTLREAGLLDEEQARELTELRDRARPGGLKLAGVLGKGASATVYEARDAEGRRLAVKLMKGTTPRDFKRRDREARALDRLRHEGIPRLLATGDVEGRPYYVMDLVEGESLSKMAKRKGPLPWPVVVEVGLAVARALEHVHEAGMVHRDVKPANVVVTDGGARLVDFGLACRPGVAARTTAIGTPGYISPELARGEHATIASDVYSFGAMLYYALTGRYPFDAESAEGMILRAADPELFVQPLLMFREDLPGRLIAVVERCMEKDTAVRFTDMKAIIEVLERVRVRVARCARRIATGSSKVRSVRRRRRLFGFAAA